MLELIALGFFVSLGAKGGIDTYDGAKDILTKAVSTDKIHDTIEKVKGAASAVVSEVEKGATAAKTTVVNNTDTVKKVVVDGADKAKKAVKDASHVIHEAVDNTLGIHKDAHAEGKSGERELNEERIGAEGDALRASAA